MKGSKEIEKRANALRELRIEYVPIDTVVPNDYNPNRQSDHDFDLLKRSITEDGFTQPIIVHVNPTGDGKNPIVDGEHRWRAARDLGYTQVPVVKVDMTKEQMMIATLRHNRARGSEDVELSAQVLRDLRELGALDWAQDSLQLDDAEITKLIDEISAPDALADETFAEAWEPDKSMREEEFRGGSASGMREGQATSYTPVAADRQREMERRIAEARTQEEREQVRRDARIYRLTLLFHGDEADVVKNALGERPAETVLQMCRSIVSAGVEP